MSTTSYDPSLADRSLLEEPTEEELQDLETSRVEDEKRLRDIRDQLAEMGKQLGMVGSEGWKQTQQDISLAMREVYLVLASPQTPLDRVGELRGRLAAMEEMLHLGEALKHKHDILKLEQKEIEDRLDGKTVQS